MVNPREKKLVRLYIQLTTTDGEGRGKKVGRNPINPHVERYTFPSMENKVIVDLRYGYCKFKYKYFEWWTIDQIGQRVGSNLQSSLLMR